MLVFEKILELLNDYGADYIVHTHEPVRTIQDAHEKVPHLTRDLLKTVVFRVKNGSWILAAVGGSSRIHYKKLAEAFGLKRTELRSVSPEQVQRELGFEIGSVGPFSVNENVKVVFDESLADLDKVFCGSGKKGATIEIDVQDLITASQATVFPVARSDTD